jgi:membrane-associated PAP2 superfamily phosphatase
MTNQRWRGNSTMTVETHDALKILLSCFAVASLSGLAVLLRSKRPLTVRNIVSAFLYNGLAGLIIGLLWFNYSPNQSPYFIVGVSGLAGMGFISLVEFAQAIVVNGVRVIMKEKDSPL